MGRHVIVGAGAVGSETAKALVALGHQVRMVTRTGSGLDHPEVERVAGDASDRRFLAGVAEGADALYNCANPPYHRWPELWPPLATALLAAAESSGAGLVTMGNLYGYGPVDRPMTEDTPLAATYTKARVRITMWEDALAAHRDGRIRATEARASDFFGPGVVQTSFFGRNVARLLAGKTAWILGDPDVPHSATYTPDVGRTLAVLGTDDRSWGRAWHVPTAPACSQRELSARLCALAGLGEPTVRSIPGPVLAAVGLFAPEVREFKVTRYQFDHEFVIDSSACTRTFGIEATPLDRALEAVLADARGRATCRPPDGRSVPGRGVGPGAHARGRCGSPVGSAPWRRRYIGEP